MDGPSFNYSGAIQSSRAIEIWPGRSKNFGDVARATSGVSGECAGNVALGLGVWDTFVEYRESETAVKSQ